MENGTLTMSVLRRLILLACVLLLGMPATAKKIDPSVYPRVGILVCRMGNSMPISPMPKISVETNYAERQPTNNANVCLESKERLQEVFPDYPVYPGSNSAHAVCCYRNMSEPLTRHLTESFRRSGFTAVDMRQFARDQSLALFDITIAGILGKCAGTMDALFVMHYLDVGTMKVDRLGVKASNAGFTSLLYGVALFDVRSGKRLFYHSPLLAIGVTNVLAFDEAIPNNRQGQEGIGIEVEPDGEVRFECRLEDDELVGHLARLIWNGFECPQKPPTAAHQKLNCMPVKGVLALLGLR